MKKIAIIFDMNGTIVDSEVAHWKAYHDVFLEYGIDYSLDEFTTDRTTKGKKLDYTLSKHDRNDLIKEAGEIKRKKNIIFRSKTKDLIRPMPHVHKVLEHLKSDSIKIALDSTSARRDIDHLLDDHDLDSFFHIITSGDMEWDSGKYQEMSKSNRFQYIADELDIDNDRCIIVGDAHKDIIAGKDKNMKVISVPNKYTKGSDFSKADRVFQDLGDLDLKVVYDVIKSI